MKPEKKQQYEKPELVIHENLNEVTKGAPTPSPSTSPLPSVAF